MSRKWLAALLVLLILGGGGFAFWKTQYSEGRPIDPGPLMKHRETFAAKYRRAECLVRIDFPVVEPWTGALSDQVFRNLMRFIAEDRPQTGGFQYRLDPGKGRLDLPGKSGERFSDYAASASKRQGLLYPRAECRLTGLWKPSI